MKSSWKLPAVEHYRVLFEVGSFSGLSDGELLARFVEREADTAEIAFAALVERHGLAVMRICRSIVRNEHDAEDAFQATFLILATKASRLRVQDSLGPWLSAVAQRVARGARAVALARAARELRAAEQVTMRESGSDGGADVSSIVHEEMDRLPERYRLPLLLCDIESHTHQEAARRLGWPLGTVKSRQARARARLRARLIRRGLSGTLPLAGSFKPAQAAISEELIRSTAQAAVGLPLREAAGRAISAAVATLVTNFLRDTIVTRLTGLIGVVLLITAGVAASVLAQGQSERKMPSADSVTPDAAQRKDSPTAAEPAPVFEYEIRIWKDGAPVTPTMKLRAHPGDRSEVKIPEGTFELRFRPSGETGKSGERPLDAVKPVRSELDTRIGDALQPGRPGMDVDPIQRIARELLNTKLEIIKVESDLKAGKDANRASDEQIQGEFQKDPDVIALRDEIARTDEQRAQAKKLARQSADPARVMAERKYMKLLIEYDSLWKAKYEEIGNRLNNSAIGRLDRRLASLKERQVKQIALFKALADRHLDPTEGPIDVDDFIARLFKRLNEAQEEKAKK
jgi:RNA polymerase sigma factor (sigma-70 family)